MNLPNKLTILRICLIPLFVIFAKLDGLAMQIIAVVIYIAACVTDMLDGQAISSEMLSGQTLQDQAARLLDGALSAGGTDNVSFILLHLNVTTQKNRRSFRAFLRSTREWLVRRIRACTKISGKS